MKRFLSIALVAGTFLRIPATAAAQPPASLEPAATARFSGRVVNAEGGGPIEGAFVRLVSNGANLTELTDARGAYEFSGLKPGSYTLSWDKTGFLVRGQKVGLLAMAGQRKVEIRPGQSLREADLVLERWGVIAVHVTDDLGIPHARIEVRALSVAGAGSDRKLSLPSLAVFNSPNFTSAKEFETDDKGDARIYGLPAGDYVVVARPWRLPITGQGSSDRDAIFPPLYYPGELSAARAQAMSLRAGEELSVDIRLTPARTADISGRVMRSDGNPGRGFVILRWNPAGVLYPANLIGDVLYRSDLEDGRFLFDSLAPGDYLVETSYDRESQEFDGEASIAVTLNGDDVTDLLLTTTNAGRMEAR